MMPKLLRKVLHTNFFFYFQNKDPDNENKKRRSTEPFKTIWMITFARSSLSIVPRIIFFYCIDKDHSWWFVHSYNWMLFLAFQCILGAVLLRPQREPEKVQFFNLKKKNIFLRSGATAIIRLPLFKFLCWRNLLR